MTGSTPAPSTLSFEAALAELEQIVRDMEQGKAGLDESIAAYERGVALKNHCQQRLDAAQMRISQITADSTGTATLKTISTDQ